MQMLKGSGSGNKIGAEVRSSQEAQLEARSKAQGGLKQTLYSAIEMTKQGSNSIAPQTYSNQ